MAELAPWQRPEEADQEPDQPLAPWDQPTYKPGKEPAGPPGPRGSVDELRDMLTTPGVNYGRGADVQLRMQYFQAKSEDEVRMLLQRRFGLGNYRQDYFGNWLVREKGNPEWFPVLPKGLLEGFKNLGALGAAEGPQMATTALGGMTGGMLGGPPGAILGAGAGAGAGSLATEADKAARGIETPGAMPGRVAGDVAMGMGFEAAGPVASKAKQPTYDALSGMLKRASGMTPQTQAIAQRLQRFGPGATPPLMSVAPNLKAFAYDRYLRNMLRNDPRQAGRIAALDERTKEVLSGFGLEGEDLAKAVVAVQDSTSALSPHEAVEGAKGILESREKQEVDRLNSLKTETLAQRGMVERQLARASMYLFQRGEESIANVGDVGGRAARVLEHNRGVFMQSMDDTYKGIHDMAGGNPVVPTIAIQQEARAIANGMDPMTVPQELKPYLVDEAPLLITIEQAHNLRTRLRALSQIHDTSPIGQRAGMLRKMAYAVDTALVNAGRFSDRGVAEELRNADRIYSEGIKVFDLPGVKELTRAVREGRTPNPVEVADMLVDKKSAEAARRVWDQLSPELQAEVKDVDFGRIVRDTAIIDKTGRRMVDPGAFDRALDQREELIGFVYSAKDMADLRDIASGMRLLNGSVDITALPQMLSQQSETKWGQQLRRYMERAIGAKKALEEETQKSGRTALDGLKSNDPDLQKTGARYFIAPGNEPRTLGGMKMMGGQDSPAWKAVQRFAIQDLLNSAMGEVPGVAKGRTISSGKMAEYLKDLTPAQQQALFGSQLQDLKFLAEEAQALFPEMDQQFGASLAAAAILGHLPKVQAVRKYLWSNFTGWLGDRPNLVQALVGVYKTDPYKGRALLSYMIQAGTQVAAHQGTMASTDPNTFSGLYGPVPKKPSGGQQLYGP